MTNEEIAAMVAESTKTLVETAQGIIEDNKRLAAENEALKNPKKPEPKVATDEELEKVMNRLMPEYEGLQISKEKKEPKLSIDQTIDDMLKHI